MNHFAAIASFVTASASAFAVASAETHPKSPSVERAPSVVAAHVETRQADIRKEIE